MKAINSLIYRIFFLLATLSSVGAQDPHVSQMSQKLADTLRTAQGLPPERARELIKTENIYDNLIRSLTDAGGQDWAHPSSERLALAAEYGSVIAQSFEVLLRAATIDQANNKYDREILEVMKFASANRNTRDILAREVAENPKFELRRNELLLQTDGFSDEDVARIASTVESASPDTRRSLLGFYSDWGLVELAPYYAELLNTEPEKVTYQSKFGNFTEGEFHATIRVAAQAFAHLGDAPPEVVERMRNLLEKYGRDILGAQIESLLQNTIAILEGKRPPVLKLAANGSGPLNLSVEEAESKSTASPAGIPTTATATSPTPTATESPRRHVSSSEKSPEPKPPSTLPWLIGIAIIAAIIIGAVMIRRKA